MEAITLLKHDRGRGIPRTWKWSVYGLKIILIIMVWWGHYWIWQWLKNGA